LRWRHRHLFAPGDQVAWKIQTLIFPTASEDVLRGEPRGRCMVALPRHRERAMPPRRPAQALHNEPFVDLRSRQKEQERRGWPWAHEEGPAQ